MADLKPFDQVRFGWSTLIVMVGRDKLLHVPDYDELSELDLGAFPVVRNFKVLLKHIASLGHHVELHDESGFLAGFPWWDHAARTLRMRGEEAVPIGTIENPFEDLEQGWQILIFEQGDKVYVLEGPEPVCPDFPVWFAVPREEYFQAWKDVIEKVRADERRGST